MDSNNNQNDGFQYTYSAREQAEVKKIRDKYITEKENKMEKLRRLDAQVTHKALAAALIVGILGALILGFGMSLCMTELAKILGEHSDMSMIIGVAIGTVGGILVCLAYPIYNLAVRRGRKKAAPEIIRLTDELMK